MTCLYDLAKNIGYLWTRIKVCDLCDLVKKGLYNLVKELGVSMNELRGYGLYDLVKNSVAS